VNVSIKTFICLAILFAFARANAASPIHEPGATGDRTIVIGYFTEGGAKAGRYTVKDLAQSGAAGLLSELDYAFGRVDANQCQIADREAALEHLYTSSESVNGQADPDGPDQLRGTFHQLQELKQLYPRLRIVISFGGWGGSDGFSSAAEPEHLKEFVRSCVHTFVEGYFGPGIHQPGIFDGIDIDWEYPVSGGVSPGHPEDKKNFTTMVREFRRQLDAVRHGLLLTAALPAEFDLYPQFELKQIARYLDDVAIMAYDMHWNSEPVTNLHSALFHDSADPSKPPRNDYYGEFAVQDFIRAGVSRRKIVLGVPFYGKGWAGVAAANHGLYQSATGPSQAPGAYRNLKELPPSADRQYYAGAATCSVWYAGDFWSYDCPQAMRAKREYALREHLGGLMFWELSHDTADGELLRALAGQQ
jgi:chitinase